MIYIYISENKLIVTKRTSSFHNSIIAHILNQNIVKLFVSLTLFICQGLIKTIIILRYFDGFFLWWCWSFPGVLIHNSCQVCSQSGLKTDGLHAVPVQVAIAVVACCVEHSSGQACYDTTREVGDWPPDEAPTSLRASRLQQADKFQLAFYLTELLLVIIFVSLVLYSFLQLIFSLLCTLILCINFIFLNLCLFVLFLFLTCSFSALQESLNQNFLLIISHREAQRDYSLNFPGSRTIQEVWHQLAHRLWSCRASESHFTFPSPWKPLPTHPQAYMFMLLLYSILVSHNTAFIPLAKHC